MPVPFEHFRDYSTLELLIIARTPDEFTPEAIESVKHILSEREVTDEVLSRADEHFHALGDRKKRIETYKDSAATFIQDTFRPSNRLSPEKWVPILLVVYGALFIWKVCKFLYFLFHSSNESVFTYLLLEDQDIVILPAIIYLVFKKEKWGWILLFGMNVFNIVLGLFLLIDLFSFLFHVVGIESQLIALLFHGAVFSYLWRMEVASYFGVTLKTRKRVTINAALLGVAASIFLKML